MSVITRKTAKAAFLILSALGPALAVSAFAAESRTVLAGHVPRQIRDAAKLDHLPAAENVDLRLVVAVDQALMDKTLAGLYGPGAPKNPHFLTSAEFAQTFDLARKRQALKDFARGAGLTVSADDKPSSLVVKVSGPAASVESAFGVRLNHYLSPSGQTFRANEADPSIPTALVPHLHAVLGFSNYRGVLHHHARRFDPAAAARRSAPSSSGASHPATLNGTGPSCYFGQCALSPADIKSIYGLTSGTLTGTGQRIALLELDGYIPSDVTLYENNLFPAPHPTTPVNCYSADNSCNYCGPNQSDPCNATTFTGGQADESGTGDSGMIEVALDIDLAIALSSGAAEIRVYTAFNSNPDAVTAYSDIAADNLAKTISTSWGQDEEDAYLGDSTLMTSENTIFRQMAAQGQSMFAAAGDSGAYQASGLGYAWSANLLTDDPAAQPYVTGVGGTSLSGTIASHTETIWNNGCSSANSPGTNCQANGAGGGGIANYNGLYWPIPPYQAGVTGAVSPTYRNVPDVALNADPNSSPYNICVNGTCADTTNYTTMIGGTSAASPLWAAFTALVNQKRLASGYSVLGFANPPLYQLGASGGTLYSSNFNDITSGNNGFYSAGSGYDDASGWGSFKANALISALSAPETAAPAGLAATAMGVSSITWNWTAAPDTYYNVYYATHPATVMALGITPPYVATGLPSDASSYIVVYSTVDGIQGSAGSTISTATYAVAPSAVPSAVGYASSATFTFSACPVFPAANSCSGYAVQVSSDAGFTGTLYSTASLNQAASPLSVTGLGLTSYYARLAYLNPLGAVSVGPGVLFFMNAAVPSTPVFPSVSTGAITFGWSANGNPVGETYIAQTSTASDFSGYVSSYTGTALSAAFGGLTADASYYFRVQGLGGPFLSAGPQPTTPVVPVALSPAFVAVGSTTLTAQWGGSGNAGDAAYRADLATTAGFTTFVSSVVSSTAAAFGGLLPNTSYYARVSALSRAGLPTAFLALGSTITLTSPPTFPAQPFAALSTGSFSVAFNQGGNPAGTVYVVQASTSAAFATLTAQASTTGSQASFGGLWTNATYYVQVAALNSGGSETAFSAPAATATLVAAPAPGVAATGVSPASVLLDWSAAGFAPGTSFSAAVSLTASPFTPVATSVVTSSYAVLGGLSANTTYYGQVTALSATGDPNGAAVPLGGVSTLTNAVTAASFSAVFVSSVVVTWTALPPAPQTATAEGYRVDLATSSTFSTLTVSVSTPATAASAFVNGLNFNTTYYARVGALNWQSAPDFFSVAGATETGTAVISTGVVASGPLLLSLGGLPPPLITVNVSLPGGAFPAGTQASAISGFFGTPLTSLSGAVSNEAPITPLGAQAAFCVSGAATCLYLGGPQPSEPVLISVSYDPAQLPPGFSESSIQIMRFDASAGQWTVVPSHDDPTAHVVTALTSHFSLFAPFFLTPAAAGDLAPLQIFPQPWELGAPGGAFFASVLTFASLPAGAEVDLFTLAGELVWRGTASGAGVATWDGTNRFGRAAASGTYLAVVKSNGTQRLRRVVLIR